MSDRDERDNRARIWFDEERTARVNIPGRVVGQITQLTETPGIPVTVVRFGLPMTTLPSGRIGPVASMHHIYVYRSNGQAAMILTRLDPFHYEFMHLTDLEMKVVMGWAKQMDYDGIGTFIPADGGWFWWPK